MKAERVIIAMLCLVWAGGGGWAAERDSGLGEGVALAKNMVKAMVRGDFKGASKDFTAELAAKVPPKILETGWASLVQRAGAYRSGLGSRSERLGQLDIVYVVCLFEKSVADVQVVFNRQGKVSGLWLHDYTLEEYVNLDAFEESAVRVGTGQWELPGTLSMPKGGGGEVGGGGVVLVHGSGPHDREESIGPNKPFRDLAWGLASKGIAVVRYDKRTKVYAQKLAEMLRTSREIEILDRIGNNKAKIVKFELPTPQTCDTLMRMIGSGVFNPALVYINGKPELRLPDKLVPGAVVVGSILTEDMKRLNRLFSGKKS